MGDREERGRKGISKKEGQRGRGIGREGGG